MTQRSILEYAEAPAMLQAVTVVSARDGQGTQTHDSYLTANGEDIYKSKFF